MRSIASVICLLCTSLALYADPPKKFPAISLRPSSGKDLPELPKAIEGPPPALPPKTHLDNAPTLRRSMIPQEAVELALADLRSTVLHPLTGQPVPRIPIEEQIFYRYIWIPDTSIAKHAAVAYTLNLISRSTDVVPNPMSNPLAKGTMYRVDLRSYAPRTDEGIIDLQQWIDTWEQLGFDPSFSLLITKDTLDLVLGQDETTRPRVRVKKSQSNSNEGLPTPRSVRTVKRLEFIKEGEGGWDGKTFKVDQEGKKFQARWVEDTVTDAGPDITPVINAITGFTDEPIAAFQGKDVDLIRINGPHIDAEMFTELQERTQSLAPVVEYGYFIRRALSTIQDKGLFQQLYSGLYYQFKGIRTAKEAKKKKATDLDVLLEDLGIGDVDKGITADVIFNKARSDQRTAMLQSQVTGKWRVIYYLPTLATKPERVAFIAITLDPRDQDIDHRQDPFKNLLNPKGFAHEVIWIDAKGTPGIGIYSAIDGSRQDFVVQDVTADREVPNPHPPILQGIISCMACHAVKGHSFWIPAPNDVPDLVEENLAILGDVSDKKKSVIDTLDRLRGLYMGDTIDLFANARRSHEKVVLQATGPSFPKTNKGLTDISRFAAQEVVDIYNEHRYRMVNSQTALRELGFEATSQKQASDYLRVLLSPDPQAAIFGIVPYDPTFAAIRSPKDKQVSRSQWDLIKSYAAFRSLQVLKSLPPKNPMKQVEESAKKDGIKK